MTTAPRNLWELEPHSGEGEFLARVRELDLLSRRRAMAFRRGEYVARVRGRGLEFREARKYVDGEDVRQIDWNMTARMREPYVREYQDEREREVILALDVSPSMHAGLQERRPIEFAAELAASLAWSATASRDRLGWVLYDEAVRSFAAPERGRRPFYRALAAFFRAATEAPGRCRETDLRQAVFALQARRGKRFMIFILSDFLDRELPRDFDYLLWRHDVVLVHVHDPFPGEARPLSLQGRSPEGPRRAGIFRPGPVGGPESVARALGAESLRRGFRFASLSTRLPMESALALLGETLARRPGGPA
ncbi:MAG: DUF58 domain-containing protein [Spirochaetes bacterium]|nr:DUF58 domain-containing protein [Spirochaetota bacterium]